MTDDEKYRRYLAKSLELQGKIKKLEKEINDHLANSPFPRKRRAIKPRPAIDN
jgi:hypothetical protein